MGRKRWLAWAVVGTVLSVATYPVIILSLAHAVTVYRESLGTAALWLMWSLALAYVWGGIVRRTAGAWGRCRNGAGG